MILPEILRWEALEGREANMRFAIIGLVFTSHPDGKRWKDGKRIYQKILLRRAQRPTNAMRPNTTTPMTTVDIDTFFARKNAPMAVFAPTSRTLLSLETHPPESFIGF
jgi:hypothetical protein